MAQATLKKRVENLERLVEELRGARLKEPDRDAWRATIGMFAGDGVAKEVIDGALRLRARERKQQRS
jgi:hypothetical protein